MATKEEFIVEKILDKRRVGAKVEYLLKWEGYPEEESTWEKEENLNCPKLIEEFNKAAGNGEDNSYDVEKILDKRIRGGEPHYLIKWKGYSKKECSWEPESHLNCNRLLKAFNDEKTGGRDASSSYDVDRILGKRIRKEKLYYLVKWKGYPESEASWEPEENLDCDKLLRDFNNEKMGEVEESLLRGFDRGLKPAKIIEALLKDGNIYYLMSWLGSFETDMIPANVANAKCPEVVIKFHEERITWKVGAES
ncbi:hypothetical protein LSTR_LSTR006196 [Laodelphax striatellus]|uniref:Chromo domain-containing protein n=1 Tax=Laodelphax striatellus TaxID=195883 RepID=A0A482XS04_LAOST|nr:hypothetical protein LSTR_LSTR006196 [Laodelphax striatellus]